MDVAARHRAPLLTGAVISLALVAFAMCVVERQGLGLGHLFYVPIVIAAFAAGPRAGLITAGAATVLYQVGIVVNPRLPPDLQVVETSIRLATFTAVALVVGLFARSNRILVAQLSKLANRDALTSLPNTRAFEVAIDRRLGDGEPFALLIGDVDELRRLSGEEGDQALMRLAERLSSSRRVGDDVARVGGDEFAVLAALPPDGARALALALEAQLSSGLDSITFGWATFPDDGENALSLYRAADERLYARKVTRGYRRGFAQEPAPVGA